MRNYSSASPATSIQNVELSWDTKAQNLLISYNKSRTFTTATLVEIIALIQQARSEIPVVGGGNGNGNGNDDTNPTLPEELTAEQIRDKLQTLEANARLDASSIKNISKNVFVRVDGADMVLQDFMELLFEYIRKSGALTREAIIEKLGFEPFNSSKVVQDLSNPKKDEVISTEGLKTILENFDAKTSKIFEYYDSIEVICNHDFEQIITPTIYVGNEIALTWVSTENKITTVKFEEPQTGKIIITRATI